jgi:peptidoglycan/xylan/chitin deacetylase (PgdA/CDA1 family)
MKIPGLGDLFYRSFFRLGGDQLLWGAAAGRLRILCYHGICEDRLEAEPWMPHFFVTQSAFDRQLEYLKRRADVLPLTEALARLHSGSASRPLVAITFDDGYANNLHLAQPVLQAHHTPATIFVSSAYVESGDYFPFLKLKLAGLTGYRSGPLEPLMRQAEPLWPAVKQQLNRDQQETLRPLTLEEIHRFDSSLVELGAHSHTHCILGNESRKRRDWEIRTSIRKVSEWSGRQVRLFSYPNGEPGDFNEDDKHILAAHGIEAAVAGIAGSNTHRSDRLALRRFPVGLFHDRPCRFSAEVSGLRATVRSVAGALS